LANPSSEVTYSLPSRRIHVVADAAYAGKELRGMPGQVTWTTRLRKDAALYDVAPPRTGQPGRPRQKGKRLPKLAALARTATFTPATVLRYGKTGTVHVATVRCLWYSVFGPQHVTVVLLREDAAGTGYELALVTTDLKATAAQVVERYAARWCVEVAIEDAKQLVGVGQAHNRKALAVSGPSHSDWPARRWQSAGTPPPGTSPKTSPSTAPAGPGTPPRPTRPHRTCSRSSAASSSPPDFASLGPNSRPRQNSRPFAWPGRTLGGPSRVMAKVELLHCKQLWAR